MHILYLHQYFTPPDGVGATRSYEMARRLVAAGHRVTLVTSTAFFPPERLFTRLVTDIELDGISLKVVRVPYSNRLSYGRRLWAFARFALVSSWIAMGIAGIDVVLASSTPLTIVFPGMAAKWRRRVPMVFEVRDQWPMVPIELGIMRNRVAIALARWLERFAYAQAAAVIALSPDMRDGIAAIGVDSSRIAVIANGADVTLFRVPATAAGAFLRRHPYLASGPLVVYAGSLGYIHGVDYLVRLAEAMRKIAPTVRFAIAGDGAKREELVALAGDRGVLGRNLWFLGALPKSEVPALLAAATVACSTVIDSPALLPNSANKIFDAMAAGKPIAINYAGWQKHVLEQSGAGIALPREPAEAAEALVALLSDEARLASAAAASAKLGDTLYHRDLLARQLEQVLRECVPAAALRSRPRSENPSKSVSQEG